MTPALEVEMVISVLLPVELLRPGLALTPGGRARGASSGHHVRSMQNPEASHAPVCTP